MGFRGDPGDVPRNPGIIFITPRTIDTSADPFLLEDIYFTGGSVGIVFPVFCFIYIPTPNTETLNTRNPLEGAAKGWGVSTHRAAIFLTIVLLLMGGDSRIFFFIEKPYC